MTNNTTLFPTPTPIGNNDSNQDSNSDNIIFMELWGEY